MPVFTGTTESGFGKLDFVAVCYQSGTVIGQIPAQSTGVRSCESCWIL